MLRRLLVLPLMLLLAACSKAPETSAVQPAVAIEPADECHLCGMIIEEQPGPKGQLYLRGDSAARKFCSVAEMFAFLLQPEHRERVNAAYVHDVAAGTWSAPNDEAFVPAREAWYVLGHDQAGSMGHALASFRDKSAAEAFAQQHGGKVLAFDQIDLDALSHGRPQGHGGSGHHGDHTQHGDHPHQSSHAQHNSH